MPAVPANGPFVHLAVICEEVRRDEDGSLNVIRITDGIVILEGGPAELHLKAVVSVVAGSARGEHLFHFVVRSPSGSPISSVYPMSVRFDADNSRRSAIGDLVLRPVEEGLHWLEVSLDQHVITKAPLTIRWAPDVRGAKRFSQ